LIVGGLGSALGAVLGTIFIVLLRRRPGWYSACFSAQIDATFTTGAQEAQSNALRPRHHPVSALPAAWPGRRLARHPAHVGELALRY